jgi:hypothetical protein
MLLTEEQRNILKKAASGYTGVDFSTLDQEDIQYYTRRVEDAIKEVYLMNPSAFIYRYKNNEKVDDIEVCLQREFYHAPLGIASYKSAKTHKIVFPEHIAIKQGVK